MSRPYNSKPTPNRVENLPVLPCLPSLLDMHYPLG